MLMIDADSHVIEGEETWSYLDPAYHSRRPIPVTVPDDTSFGAWNAFWIIDQKVRHFGATPTTAEIAKRKAYSIGCQEITDVPERVAVMDRLRIERQVVHPSFCLSIMSEDPELEAALAQSYNSFMSDKCLESGGRLFFNAVVPFRHPDAAVQELRRLKERGGMVSVLARGVEHDKPLDHPDHYPIYEEAQRLGVPVVVHLGPGSPAMLAMFDGHPRPESEMKTFFPPRGRRLVSTLSVQFGFYGLVESSLIDDFPNLKWAFLEGGGAEWVPAAVSAIERNGKDARHYFEEGRIFIGAEPDEDLEWVARKLTPDCLVVSSDMPHFDEAAHANVIEEFEERAEFADILPKLLRDNPMKLFDFDAAQPSRSEVRQAAGE